ncbi:hypothetical protein, partial [Staphylococcus aureus]|uniref:hypothetical protein n=1 Tax=Staphylococcus aureus TaxID=1280 RepID=UPI001F3C3ED0
RTHCVGETKKDTISCVFVMQMLYFIEEITFKSNLTQKFNSYYQLIVIFLENVLSKWKISNDVNTTYSDFYTFNPYKLLFSQI